LQAIYNSPEKEISLEVFQDLVGGRGWELYLKKNVFSYHPKKNVVMFQSKVVEAFVRESLLKKK